MTNAVPEIVFNLYAVAPFALHLDIHHAGCPQSCGDS
jgi:hypothetical protein